MRAKQMRLPNRASPKHTRTVWLLLARAADVILAIPDRVAAAVRIDLDRDRTDAEFKHRAAVDVIDFFVVQDANSMGRDIPGHLKSPAGSRLIRSRGATGVMAGWRRHAAADRAFGGPDRKTIA